MPAKSKLVYLTPAREDFKKIVQYHTTKAGVLSGKKIYSVVKTALEMLRDFPLMGQTHPDPLMAAESFRKLVLTETYVAIYKIVGDTVYIYRIVNGRTDYPKLLK